MNATHNIISSLYEEIILIKTCYLQKAMSPWHGEKIKKFQSNKYMNTRNTYHSLNQTSLSLAAKAGRLLGKGMETNEVDDLTDAAADSFFAKTISAPLLNSKAAPDLCDQNGGWDLAFHMTIMMDIRGANP